MTASTAGIWLARSWSLGCHSPSVQADGGTLLSGTREPDCIEGSVGRIESHTVRRCWYSPRLIVAKAMQRRLGDRYATNRAPKEQEVINARMRWKS